MCVISIFQGKSTLNTVVQWIKTFELLHTFRLYRSVFFLLLLTWYSHTYICSHTFQWSFYSCMYLSVIYRVCCSGFIKAMISHKMSAMVVNMTRGACACRLPPQLLKPHSHVKYWYSMWKCQIEGLTVLVFKSCLAFVFWFKRKFFRCCLWNKII